MPNKFKYDEHRTDDANSGSHLAFLLFPHPFIFSLYRKRSHNCKVQPVKTKRRTLRNTLASTAFVPSTSFTCHTNACKLCIKCPPSKPGQLLHLLHFFHFSLMLLYQEEGICYSLHGRRRTLLTERRMRKKSNATMPRLLGRIMCHTIYRLMNLDIAILKSFPCNPMFCRGPGPTLFGRHLSTVTSREWLQRHWLLRNGMWNSE